MDNLSNITLPEGSEKTYGSIPLGDVEVPAETIISIVDSLSGSAAAKMTVVNGFTDYYYGDNNVSACILDNNAINFVSSDLAQQDNLGLICPAVPNLTSSLWSSIVAISLRSTEGHSFNGSSYAWWLSAASGFSITPEADDTYSLEKEKLNLLLILQVNSTEILVARRTFG